MIPTAEEFMNSKNYWHSEDYYSLLIEFAKLHVEAALQAAEEIAIEFDSEGNYDNSILNAYPLENIK